MAIVNGSLDRDAAAKSLGYGDTAPTKHLYWPTQEISFGSAGTIPDVISGADASYDANTVSATGKYCQFTLSVNNETAVRSAFIPPQSGDSILLFLHHGTQFNGKQLVVGNVTICSDIGGFMRVFETQFQSQGSVVFDGEVGSVAAAIDVNGKVCTVYAFNKANATISDARKNTFSSFTGTFSGDIVSCEGGATSGLFGGLGMLSISYFPNGLPKQQELEDAILLMNNACFAGNRILPKGF